MKKVSKIFSVFFLIFALMFSFSSCAFDYEAHGFDDYLYEGNYNSTVEIDWFQYEHFDIATLVNDYSCVNADYYFTCTEDFWYYNCLHRAIYYFEYAEEQEYQAAKAYCTENLPDLGDEITEEYNGFQFYDFFGNRPKDRFYHGDNYPSAFKRFAFSDKEKAIVFLGVYTTDQHADEMAKDVQDWGAFLNKYFFEFYCFGE